MKIASLINIVENIENLHPDKFNINKTSELITTYLPKTYDIYNDSLLEMVLRFKEKLNKNIYNSITVLSVNNSSIDYFLKNLYAHNIDKIVRINREEKEKINYNTIGLDIRNYIEKNSNFDIILSGKKGMLNGSGLIPYKVANLLNYQVVDNIIDINPYENNNYIKVTTQENNQIKDLLVKLPMVGIVSDISTLILRVPTLKNKINAKKKSLTIFDPTPILESTNNIAVKIIHENNIRNYKEVIFNSKKEIQTFLKEEINKAKNLELDKKDITKDFDGIYAIKQNGFKIYFCNKESVCYNSFVSWNIENNIKIFLDIDDFELNEKNLIIKKKIYAENLTSLYTLPSTNQSLSIVANKNTINKILKRINVQIKQQKIETKKINNNEIINIKTIQNNETIENEKVLLAIGKGVGNKKNLEAIKAFAKNNNIKIVGTRIAAMNAYIPLLNMVGVSSKQISPNLLICIGLSGAPAFYEGVKDSKKIISINNDENAPIFSNSDIKIATDLKNIFN